MQVACSLSRRSAGLTWKGHRPFASYAARTTQQTRVITTIRRLCSAAHLWISDRLLGLVQILHGDGGSGAPQQTFSWVEISPLQMDHCIGATPQEQIDCGAPILGNVVRLSILQCACAVEQNVANTGIAPPRVGITAEDVRSYTRTY